MRIERLELRNYRLFRHAVWGDLPPFAVIVGANGSGKSTFFDALSFLKECLTENVAQAVARRGGFRELVSREILRYTRRHGKSGRPWHFLDFSGGSGYAITNEAAYGQEGATEEREERVLDDPSTLAIKASASFVSFPSCRSFAASWSTGTFPISRSATPGKAATPDSRNICRHAATTSRKQRRICTNTIAIASSISWQ